MDPEEERRVMVKRQIVDRGIDDPRVIKALLAVPRDRFVPAESRAHAHEDHPIAIGHGQTISQPYIVALMTTLLDLPEHAKVLEIGAGCGYQTAVLSRIADKVCAIERLPELAEAARERLARLGITNAELHCGDGFDGWPDADARFDGILLACAPEEIPERLIGQLRPSARLVAPVGPAGRLQQLTVLTKSEDGTLRQSDCGAVRFVPMV